MIALRRIQYIHVMNQCMLEKHSAMHETMKRYLALGDSYTIAETLDAQDRWPEQWARLVQAKGIPIAQPVHIIAQTGWTTDELMQAIADANPTGEWDWVSLLIGVNNQYRGRSVENFRQEFKQLSEFASELCRQGTDGVQVLSIPDWGQTPFGTASGRNLQQVSDEIDAFNQSAKSICDSLGIAFLDITRLTRANSSKPEMHALDGLHPSREMYCLWANALLCTGKFGRFDV